MRILDIKKISKIPQWSKKTFFLTISARVSYIKIPQDQESGDTLYKSFMYKIDKFYQKIYMKFYISFIFPRTLYRMKSDREFSKIIEESNLISLIIFEGDIQDRNYYFESII